MLAEGTKGVESGDRERGTNEEELSPVEPSLAWRTAMPATFLRRDSGRADLHRACSAAFNLKHYRIAPWNRAV